MDKLNALSTHELHVIASCLFSTLQHAIASDSDMAQSIREQVKPVIDKIGDVLELRELETEKFCEIVNELLSDVDQNSIQIIANPEIELPEYN